MIVAGQRAGVEHGQLPSCLAAKMRPARLMLRVECTPVGMSVQAVRVYEVMTAAGVEPNGASYNAALTSYARSGQLDAALTLFAAMGARGYERGTNTYAAVLAACERPGR